MIKKTFEELLDFTDTINALFTEQPDLPKTKFGYAIQKFNKKTLTPIFDEFNEALTAARIEHALEDEKTKAVLTSNTTRGFLYSKEGLKQVIAAEKEINKEWKTKEFEIEPYITKENPANLTEDQIEVLTGLVI